MHYKNGREAHNGDKIIVIPSYGPPMTGVLYDATAGNDYCNGKLAPVSITDACPNLKECLHIDDVSSALTVNGVPDTSVKPLPSIADLQAMIEEDGPLSPNGPQ